MHTLYLSWSPNAKGLFWIVLAMTTATGIDVSAKLVSDTVPVENMMFIRSLILIVALAPVVLLKGTSSVSTRRPGMHLLRALFWLGAMFTSFSALRLLTVAETNAYLMSEPLMLLPLSALLLGERITARKLLAVGIGFIGVMIMVLPEMRNPTGNMTGILYAVASAALFAGMSVVMKRMVATETGMSMLFWPQIFGALVFSLPALTNWVQPSPMDMVWISTMSGFALATNYAFVVAYRHGDPGAVAPGMFVILPLALVADMVIFDALPGVMVMAGAAMIILGVATADYRKS